MKITQYTLKVLYYSFALCLFVWGVGWLIYEYTFIHDIFGLLTFQNILLVCLGVTLSFVVWTSFSPKKDQAMQTINVKGNPSDTFLSREDLEAKLFETEPNSKERREILKQLNEMKN